MKNKDLSEGWWRFLKLCQNVKTPQQLKELFDLFFTIEEKEDCAMRYLLVKALIDGKEPQREIAERLKVSISKITRGSNALKIISPELRKFLEKEMD